MTALYEGLQNVVIKFGPAAREPEHSIMINTHFDTVPVSPGENNLFWFYNQILIVDFI
jgi:acetylornithine deacetylase/succinyl-diaminopimelate desuccinylase-like protein